MSPLTVLHHINKITTSSQGVDHINIKMLNLCLPFNLHVLTHIVNYSISSNSYPNLWKQAYVIPTPKVEFPSTVSHFRPISLLPTISKVLEKVVAEQMCNYFDNHNLWNPNQSGFRKQHSTATALLKITSEITDAMDRGDITILSLLDFSKAFDTVNHPLLLAKLKSLGFMDPTLLWFTSYLENRKQCVISNSKCSNWIATDNGVPQGSILGPILYLILAQDLSRVITSSSHHFYADDTQLYTHCSPSNIESSISELNSDLTAVHNWSARNALQLNISKCLYIIIASPYNIRQLHQLDLPSIKINNISIPRVDKCKNLGVIFDSNLTWKPYFNSLISKSYFKLRNLSRYKHFLSTPVKLHLCDSLILSNFNYCSALFNNCNSAFKNKAQKVQNSCLRYSFLVNRREHISPALLMSKWLNMKYRQLYFSLILVYKIVHNLAPSYLYNILYYPDIPNTYSTRSQHLLPLPRFSRHIKEYSFFVSTVRNFNQLPDRIKSCHSLSSFKFNLKVFLLSDQHSSYSQM